MSASPPLPTHLIRPEFEIVSTFLAKKLSVYVELFDTMEQHGGWLPYPQFLLDYLNKLGVRHWAELYWKDGQHRWAESHRAEIEAFALSISEVVGQSPSPEDANEFLNALIERLSEAIDTGTEYTIFGLEPLEQGIENVDLDALTDEQRQAQFYFWMVYHINFYNDLSIATHGEPIFELVRRAIEENDIDAMVMAVQIDRSLMPFFQNHFWDRTMRGASDFWDALAYRINNPPTRGRNAHPLLWILFKDLRSMRCLDRITTSKQILDLYCKAVGEHQRFAIVDELVVQRQRRKFLAKSRQPK